MPRFQVDTSGLAAEGASISSEARVLTNVRVAVMRTRGAAGAAGDDRVDAALDHVVARWGISVNALQEAAAGLGKGAELAAQAYERTDRTAIGN